MYLLFLAFHISLIVLPLLPSLAEVTKVSNLIGTFEKYFCNFMQIKECKRRKKGEYKNLAAQH